MLASDVVVRRSRSNGGYVRRLNSYGSMPVADSFFAFLPRLRRRRVLGDRRYLSSRLHHRLQQWLPSTFSRLAV